MKAGRVYRLVLFTMCWLSDSNAQLLPATVVLLTDADNASVMATAPTDGPLPSSNHGAGGGGKSAAKTALYLGGFFALTDGGWDGSGVLVAVDMALEYINADPDVLVGYELKMVAVDARCDAGLGTRLFFEQIRLPPQKLMLIGPACSTTAQAVAQTSFYWNLITMSYSAASSALSNRVVFPYFYRTYMPDSMLNRARIRLIKEFGWQRVATIHQNQDLFSLAINDMINLMKAENITLISSESFDEDPTNQVANLKALDARIIIVNMYESKARRVMCEAGRQGMIGPGYVWFHIGWFSYSWWELDDPTVIKCTTAEYKMAVEGSYYISTESTVFGDNDAVTVAGITPLDFDLELRRRLTLPENSAYTYNGIATYGFDAAWAIALALNESAEILKTKAFEDGSIRRLEDFTYDDKEMSQVFFESLDKTNFYGTSGPVSFLGADRLSFTQIEQLRVGCWPNWIEHCGSCFMLVRRPLNLEDAVSYCRTNDNSQLASVDVNNGTEVDWLFRTLKESEGNIRAKNTKWLFDTIGDTDYNSTNGTCSALDISGDAALIVRVSCSLPLSFVCQDQAELIEVLVGTYDTANDVLKMTSEIIWPGGEVPPDRTPVIPIHRVEEYVGIDFVVFVCLASLAGIGILLSLFFLAFNVRYRALRIVRMSSPNLNNIILIGTVIVYASVVLYGIDRNLVAEKHLVMFCHIRVWFFAVGFVLAFGAMFSKTWRVHKVVARKTPKRKVVQDSQLIFMVAALLVIDVAIILPWQLIFPWRVDKIYLPEKQDAENTLIRVPYITVCTGKYYLYWTIALVSFKGLLLLFGAFLAWETRQVTIPALNDSKLIGISVYNVVILCIVALAINLVLGQDTQTLYIFNSSISIFCTSLAILIVFLPKVLAVIKNPMEDPMRESTTRTMTRNSLHDSNSHNREMIQENRSLKERVAQLEKSLEDIREKKGNDKPLSSGPTRSQLRTRTCNLGVWCCGLICGCSPGEVHHQPAVGHREDELVRSAHVNEVDLSLETATGTTVGTPVVSPVASDPNHATQSKQDGESHGKTRIESKQPIRLPTVITSDDFTFI